MSDGTVYVDRSYLMREASEADILAWSSRPIPPERLEKLQAMHQGEKLEIKPQDNSVLISMKVQAGPLPQLIPAAKTLLDEMSRYLRLDMDPVVQLI